MTHMNEPIEARRAVGTGVDPSSGEFDPTSVFADPVAYLAQFGVRSELVVTSNDELPAAA